MAISFLAFVTERDETTFLKSLQESRAVMFKGRRLRSNTIYYPSYLSCWAVAIVVKNHNCKIEEA
eukprot:scaffold4301_cov144-Skeletonema_menzelii.AAC.1